MKTQLSCFRWGGWSRLGHDVGLSHRADSCEPFSPFLLIRLADTQDGRERAESVCWISGNLSEKSERKVFFALNMVRLSRQERAPSGSRLQRWLGSALNPKRDKTPTSIWTSLLQSLLMYSWGKETAFASTRAPLFSSITQGMMSCLNRTFSDRCCSLSELTSCIFLGEGGAWITP